MEKAESFEVTEYSDKMDRLDRKFSVIYEIVQERISEMPNTNVRVTFTGDLMRLSYHSYEAHLPVRMRDVEQDARSIMDQTIKLIKKQYKGHGGVGVLKLTEKKELADYSVQKVSLNERYMYTAWRFYELG